MWEVRKRLEHLGAVTEVKKSGRGTGGGFNNVRLDLLQVRLDL